MMRARYVEQRRGVALLRANGQIVYASDTLRHFAQRSDGFRISDCEIEFVAPDARRRFDAALGAAKRIGDASSAECPADFPVPRGNGMPAYVVSVRPLVRWKARVTQNANAEIMVFFRDPLSRNIADRKYFGSCSA